MAEVADLSTAIELGLNEEEFQKIKEFLNREPNFTELCAYSVMWSEHCSYKNSILWLKTLPKEGPMMLSKAGEENAGVVDIGGGLGCSFKIESHNHPSAIEPYQGAATGVGGINRDIFTMGARPIAQLNSLRFGDLSLAKTKRLLKGVVKGIGDYGNSFGVPTVGGEIHFDPTYNVNPLVNAFSAGIVDKDGIVSATAHGAGNPVFIIGSATGKDGIHGAAFASKDIGEDSEADLPSVQVGDPFQEKLLLEATLEVIKTGNVVGMQDMGAAGIICSCSEMSEKGGAGMDIYLDKVPTRQENMKAWELLLSESQERMLLVAKKGTEEEIKKVFEKWDLNCVEIGVVNDSGILKYYHHDELVAEIPAPSLVLGGGAPVYERAYKAPENFDANATFDINSIKEPEDYEEAATFLLKHINIASKKWVSEQYDSMVGAHTSSSHQKSDAGIVKVPGTDKALVVTVDCPSRYINADPEKGTAIAVAEAARNIVCSGGKPLAVTNCLNFGNPYVPEVYWQFVSAIKGMSKACEAFGTPVTGGNVSFYNQSSDQGPVFPTPTIGMLGLLEDYKDQVSLGFKGEGDLIYLLGPNSEDVACSEYLYSYHKIKNSPAPDFELDEELKLQGFLAELNKENLAESMHDCSDGGLFTALCESAFENEIGFEVRVPDSIQRADGFLFGEAQSRVIITIKESQKDILEEKVKKSGLQYCFLGITGTNNLSVKNKINLDLLLTKENYEGALHEIMEA